MTVSVEQVAFSECFSDAARQVADFVAAVFDPSDVVEVRRIHATNGARSMWHLAGELAASVPSLRAENADGWNVYVGVNPRRVKGLKGDANVILTRCLFVDFDGGVSVPEALGRVDAAKLPEPTIVLASGHGVHVYWRLAEPFADPAEWRERQKDLIALLGSDPSIHNPERIMRLPGVFDYRGRAQFLTRCARVWS